MKREDRIELFVETIWDWFATHKRELPWRDLSISNDTERAYQVLVSEIMLQQTQVTRVKIVFKDFLLRFPKLRDLATASNTDVLLAWRGMGYNSRALRLRDAAKTIMEDFHGVFPSDFAQLKSIKGIGDYTAAAIMNFAFCIPLPCIDTNIRRILHRTFVGPENHDGTWKKDDRYLLQIAEEVMEEALKHPSYTTADWHAALMDFGSLVCTKRSPKWDICPLTEKGICKSSYKVVSEKKKARKEPGREMAGRFVPNRIFRGKVVEELRNAESGLTANTIGNRVCIDWSQANHTKWLEALLQSLQKDQLITSKGSKYFLS